MAAKRTWTIWIPAPQTVVDHVSGETAEIGGHGELGRLYRRAALLGDLTRDEAERIARDRHGDEAIVTRHRGGEGRADWLYERDLRPAASR